MSLSIKSTLRQVLSNPEGRKILSKYFGELINDPVIKMIQDISLDQIAKLAGNRVSPKLINQINQELMNIKY